MPPSLVVRVAGNLEDLKKSLKEGEAVIQSTSAQVQKLANSFNGDRLIAHAHNVTAAIKEVGVTTLTASQSARNLDLLERAMDKMRRTGDEIPPTMTRTAERLRFMARTAEEGVPAGAHITATYRQFDGVLQSMGVNIGPYVKGLEDITALAGAGAGTVGLLAGGAAAVATAIGAWKFGTAIGETYGLTDAIGKGWAAILGWGDAERERALAIADSLDLMGKAEANQKRAAQAAADHAKAVKEESDQIKENWRITDGNKDALARLQQQLDATAEKRKKDAIAAFQASQAQTTFGKTTDEATEKVKAQTTALDEREASLKRIATEAEAAQKKINDFMTAATLNDRQAQSSSSDLSALTGTARDQVVADYHQAGDTNDAQAFQRALAALEGMEGRYKVTDNRTFYAMQKNQALLAQLRMLKESGEIPGFAGGVENFSGGLAYVHRNEMLVNLPKGTNVVPAGAGGTTVNLTLNVNAPVMGSVRELAELVTKEFTNMMRGRGERFAPGV